eukprot:3185737-Rhodomonas_salina.1
MRPVSERLRRGRGTGMSELREGGAGARSGEEAGREREGVRGGGEYDLVKKRGASGGRHSGRGTPCSASPAPRYAFSIVLRNVSTVLRTAVPVQYQVQYHCRRVPRNAMSVQHADTLRQYGTPNHVSTGHRLAPA